MFSVLDMESNHPPIPDGCWRGRRNIHVKLENLEVDEYMDMSEDGCSGVQTVTKNTRKGPERKTRGKVGSKAGEKTPKKGRGEPEKDRDVRANSPRKRRAKAKPMTKEGPRKSDRRQKVRGAHKHKQHRSPELDIKSFFREQANQKAFIEIA